MFHFIYLGVTGLNNHLNFISFPLKIVFVIANSVDRDAMPDYATFHIGLHCLTKKAFRSH